MSFELLGTVNKIRRKSNRGYDALSPVYELLLNAINAERNNEAVDKNVIINIEYTTEKISSTDKKERINYIKISDFGVGFNDTQLASFKNLNSTINQKLGCRGMGRFQIMRSFHKIKVESFNRDERFSVDLAEQNISGNDVEGFSKTTKISHNELMPTTISKEAIIECSYNDSLKNTEFHEATQITAIDIEEIKERLNSKLLLKLALLKKDEFNINITLQGEEFITNNNVVGLNGADKKFCVNGIVDDFTIYHLETDGVKCKTNEGKNYVVYVADNVEVQKDTSFFKDKPKSLYKEDNDKHYIGIVESKYLDSNVYDDRRNFDIDNEEFENIKTACNNEVKTHLSSQLETYYQDRGNIIDNVKAKYPFLKDEDLTDYKPDDTEEAVAEKGYVQSVKNEFKSFNKLEKIIGEFKDMLSGNDYTKAPRGTVQEDLFAEEDKKKEITEKAHEIADAIPTVKKHILSRTISAEYTILKQLEECIKQKGAEHYIHDIVFPRFNLETRTRGFDFLNDKVGDNGAKLAYKNANLWLVDDKYIGYDYKYLVSEKKIEDFDRTILTLPETAKKYEKDKRPDIVVFQSEESTNNGDPIFIIEFKRPNATDKIWEIIEQARDYALTISELDSRYTRFICQCINTITEEDHKTLAQRNNYSQIKYLQHYLKTEGDRKNSEGCQISITFEAISIKRFAELARQRKERCMKDLGLL